MHPSNVSFAVLSSANEEKHMINRTAIRTTALKHLVPVRTLDDLDWLLKESEILTGARGREFVVAGADRPAYLVQIDHAGYEILRIDQDEACAAPLRATAPDLVHHTLGNALACGLLYTTALQ